jgi:hypothetical protein
MIYNEETNPQPLTLKKDVTSTEVVTRKAIAYPLINNGEITVDSRKHLYVEDKLPLDRQKYDENKGALLDSIVLHFDTDGNFIEYLGQEGMGGTPFPYITGIYSSINDELAIVCRVQSGWQVYWFDKEGNALFLIPIKRDDVPIPGDKTGVASLDSVMVTPDARHLVLKVDYYKDIYDETTNTKAGIAFDGSMLWIMNVENGVYITSVPIPQYEQFTENNSEEENTELIYSLLGVSRGGKVFLYVPIAEGYTLLIVNLESKEQKQGILHIDPDELVFSTFHVSIDGIVSALLASEFEAKVVWWRTDRLIGETHK